MNLKTFTPEVVLATYCSAFEPPISNTKRKQDITLATLFNLVRSDKFKSITETLRTLKDEKANSNYKCSRFHAALISGTFNERRSSGLIHHSNLICIDIDNVGTHADVNTLKTGLASDPSSADSFVMCFTSPNGDGVKTIYLIDHTDTDFSQADWYNGICDHIQTTHGLEKNMLDKSGKDVARACFIPYDPDAIIHPSLQSLLIK